MAVLRPFARPLLRPLFGRLDRMQRQIDELDRLAKRLDRHLPIVENLIDSHNATLRTSARDVAQLRADLERAQSELRQALSQVDRLREDLSRHAPDRAPSAGADAGLPTTGHTRTRR
jgi:chromosome segregation ATPase